MLVVEQLTKRFGGFTAVDRVSFRVEQGEILGLIGPNGSGKSTTFNVIAGLFPPTSGSIQLDGVEIGGLPPDLTCRRGIARTFQIPRPFKKLSILENATLAAFYGASDRITRGEAERRADPGEPAADQNRARALGVPAVALSFEPLPREFFAAVRAELDAEGSQPSPQTRDMNPIYTGKDVSYIDTKQANRAAENAVLEAERFAVFAGLLTGATYPQAALAKAWVQLAYGAHHDAITGSESDQVYLDLLTGWRDAWELGRTARDNAVSLLSRAVDGDVVVWNPLAHSRTDIVTVHLDEPLQGAVFDADGTPVPILIEDDGRTVTWLAQDVPSLGWRGYTLGEGNARSVWEPMPGTTISSDRYGCTVDPDRGGAVSSLFREGVELIGGGRVGNEIAVYDEHSAHPTEHEGPWHLLPKGPVMGSAEHPAETVRAYRSALGERLVVSGRIGDVLRYTQTITLWHGVDRVDCRTVIDEFTGADKLLRLRWPCPVPVAWARCRAPCCRRTRCGPSCRPWASPSTGSRLPSRA